jgi:hypothetical protein
MSKIPKREYKIRHRNHFAKQLNQRADVFKDKKREPKGGRHGEKVQVEHELEEELEDGSER